MMGAVFVACALAYGVGAVAVGFLILVFAGIRFRRWVRRMAGKHRQRRRERIERDRIQDRREERIRRVWPR